MAASRSAQTTEWVYHKTADGLHPDGHQQQPHWLMNRARAKRANEGRFPANRGHDDINFGISFSGVGTALLIRECAAIAPKPPAAFDRRAVGPVGVPVDIKVTPGALPLTLTMSRETNGNLPLS